MGAILAGKYRVDRILGEGGMGVVVQAMHLQLHQPVAMKFLHPHALANRDVVSRFMREAQAAVRLKSEHVARVIDVGALDTGAPYMVLEYLQGTDLSNFPRQNLTVGLIIDFMLQACEALAEAHSIGIVHRDIKPANFFVTGSTNGELLLKVLDFGISKVPMGDNNMTATSTVMGTPAYMSPEQMRSSRDVDNRSDIWSLGVVLYELLQGAPPYTGDSFSALVIKVTNDPLPKLQIKLPGDLDQIVYRCLDKDPSRRFQNVADLAKSLSRYAGSTTQAAISVQRTGRMLGTEPPRNLNTGPALGATVSTLSTLSSAAGAQSALGMQPKKRWPLFVGIGSVVAAIVVIALIGATSGGKKPDEPAATTQPVTALPTPAPTVVVPPPPAPVPAVVVTPPPAPVTPPPAPAVVVETPKPVKVIVVKPVKPTKPVAPPTKPTKPGEPTTPPDDILGNRN